MTITALPDPPARSDDSDTFIAKADAFIGALPQFVLEANALAAEIDAASIGGGIALGYTFSTTITDSDPGNGILRLDSATQNAATIVRADNLDIAGTDWSSVLDTLDDSTSTIKGQLRIAKVGDGSKWLQFNITSVATPSGYKNISGTIIGYSGANPFSNGDSLSVSFTRTGDKGIQGIAGNDGAVALLYTFSTTTTDSDPGAGTLRLNNGTQNSATTIRTDLLDANASTVTNVLDSLDDSNSVVKGQIRLTKVGDPTKWILFSLTSIASPSGYRNLSVSVTASSSANPFSNGDSVILTFASNGDAGTLSGTATSAINEIKAADTASSSTIDLSSTVGNLVHITGTTTITAFTLAAGAERVLVFDGILTLTHNATSLILPGNLSITTAAGDRAIIRGEGSGNTRVINYTRAVAAVPFQAKGANIASASTINLDAATGDFIHVTGTTTITAVTLASGHERTVVFDGALILTHNATTLILPGGASITTAAGDRAIFRGDGSGNTRCIMYSRASGAPVTAPGAVSLALYSPSAVASLDITSVITGAYSRYIIRGTNVIPSAEALLLIRTSTNNGSSFDSGASDYAYSLDSIVGAGSIPDGSNNNSSIRMNSTGSSHAITSTNSFANDVGACFDIELVKPSSSQYCQLKWSMMFSRSASVSGWTAGGGMRKAVADVDALQLLFSTGNILSGTVEVLGVA